LPLKMASIGTSRMRPMLPDQFIGAEMQSAERIRLFVAGFK